MYPLEQRQARLKYIQHKHSVKNRIDRNGNAIHFKLTFEEWWDIWEKSGYWGQRGCSSGCYVMARYGDVGHYETSNVCIISVEKNISDGHTGSKASQQVKIRSSEVNSKPIMTPKGIFKSRREASKYFNITPEGIGSRMKSRPKEYYYI